MCWRDFAEGNHSTLATLQPSGSCLILYFFNPVSHHIDTFYILTARNSKTPRNTRQIWFSRNMDPNVQAEIERQQSQLLEKLSTIFDNEIDSMKRQLEDVSNKAHESQMSELKRMRFAEPRSFKKKGHKQQYKHNEKVNCCDRSQGSHFSTTTRRLHS